MIVETPLTPSLLTESKGLELVNLGISDAVTIINIIFATITVTNGVKTVYDRMEASSISYSTE